MTTGTITTTSTPSGAVQDNAQIALDFQASGVVSHVYVTPGQHVKAGQLLATIADPTLQNAVTNDTLALAPPTQASVEVAQATLDAAKAKLVALQMGGTPASIAQAQASLDQAKAKLAAMKAGGTPASITQAQATLDAACAMSTTRSLRQQDAHATISWSRRCAWSENDVSTRLR